MKVYKESILVTNTIDENKEFINSINFYTNEMQNKNLTIEIQYSTCASTNYCILTALILGYAE